MNWTPKRTGRGNAFKVFPLLSLWTSSPNKFQPITSQHSAEHSNTVLLLVDIMATRRFFSNIDILVKAMGL